MSDENNTFAWYLVKTLPGKESLAVGFVKKIIHEAGCDEDIEDYFVPKAINDKKNNSDLSVMMGYFAMKINLTPQMRKAIDKIHAAKVILNEQVIKPDGKVYKSRSNINHRITFFLDKKMTQADLQKMINSSEIHHDIKHIYHLNDKVIIVDGPLKNVCGVVTKINSKDKLLIDVEIVGRMVSIELDVSKIKKED